MRTELSVVQPAVHVQSEWWELKLQKWRKLLKVHISKIYVLIKKFSYIKTFLMYYSVNIPKSLMVYITPQPSSEPWRILHKTLLLYTTLCSALTSDCD